MCIHLQSRVLLSNCLQLIRALESILRTGKSRPSAEIAAVSHDLDEGRQKGRSGPPDGGLFYDAYLVPSVACTEPQTG